MDISIGSARQSTDLMMSSAIAIWDGTDSTEMKEDKAYTELHSTRQ